MSKVREGYFNVNKVSSDDDHAILKNKNVGQHLFIALDDLILIL